MTVTVGREVGKTQASTTRIGISSERKGIASTASRREILGRNWVTQTTGTLALTSSIN